MYLYASIRTHATYVRMLRSEEQAGTIAAVIVDYLCQCDVNGTPSNAIIFDTASLPLASRKRVLPSSIVLHIKTDAASQAHDGS